MKNFMKELVDETENLSGILRSENEDLWFPDILYTIIMHKN